MAADVVPSLAQNTLLFLFLHLKVFVLVGIQDTPGHPSEICLYSQTPVLLTIVWTAWNSLVHGPSLSLLTYNYLCLNMDCMSLLFDHLSYSLASYNWIKFLVFIYLAPFEGISLSSERESLYIISEIQEKLSIPV